MASGVRAKSPSVPRRRASSATPRERAEKSSNVASPISKTPTARRRSKMAPSPSANNALSTTSSAKKPANVSRKTSRSAGHEIEFGGASGAAFIIVTSHVLLYYVYYCLMHNNGDLWMPRSLDELSEAMTAVARSAAPSWTAAGLYFGFLGIEVILALVAPGLKLNGRPDEQGRVLQYNCNAVVSWYVTLAIIAALHVTSTFKLSSFIDHYGSVMTVAIVFADLQSLAWYWYAYTSGQTYRMSGNPVYDFFMGAILHPRLFGGRLDVKMFAEIRLSWFLLFILTASAAVKVVEEQGGGAPPLSLAFIVFAQFMYANATSKGEHYVPPTWDISYEKYGWMLCFWNFAGVPFLYCKGAIWLAKHGGHPSTPLSTQFIAFLFVMYCIAYYIWDTSQSQKSHFRLQQSGTVVKRFTLPSLPWSTLDEPRYIVTSHGTPLLVDGWWALARKIHYTCDIVMGLTWALCTGFGAGLPYIYPAFFITMITHRYLRDDAKCARNYGADWERYKKHVPYVFIPYVF